MAKATTSTILRAKSSFVASVGGVDVLVREGDLADSESAIVRKHPTLFGPVSLRFERVETATAAPGEKRGA